MKSEKSNFTLTDSPHQIPYSQVSVSLIGCQLNAFDKKSMRRKESGALSPTKHPLSGGNRMSAAQLYLITSRHISADTHNLKQVYNKIRHYKNLNLV